MRFGDTTADPQGRENGKEIVMRTHHRFVKLKAIFFGFVWASFAIPLAGAQTYTYSLLHTFVGHGDGAKPLAGLVRDSAGNLYGTTYYGGKYGLGSVFKMDT